MKLYTEEQVKKMIYDGNNIWYGYDAIISRYTPIELPSDEQIEENLFHQSNEYSYGYKDAFNLIKNKILNQNK